MKKIMPVTLCILTGLLLTGCRSTYTVGKDIKADDISEFYYTYSNINYNAFYQRYRFHTEDGKYMFMHDTRKRENEYGPCTEEDRIAYGDLELTEAEWNSFFDLIKDGTVTARKDSAESGDSGPWTYLYWKKDKDKYQVFEFASYERKSAFEAFCAALAEGER